MPKTLGHWTPTAERYRLDTPPAAQCLTNCLTTTVDYGDTVRAEPGPDIEARPTGVEVALVPQGNLAGFVEAGVKRTPTVSLGSIDDKLHDMQLRR